MRCSAAATSGLTRRACHAHTEKTARCASPFRVPSRRARRWRYATSLFRASEVEPEGSAVLDAAIRLGISAYDAHFVVVAEKLGVRLVTHDQGLLERCPHQAVSMLRFAQGA